jgi:tetratricopeptide (TPR) repeat protein
MELESLQRKRSRFAGSPSYLGKLADIAELAGREEVELEALRGALDKGADVRFARRLGDVLIGQNRHTEAEEFFSNSTLNADWYANLRLAFLRIQRRDYESATAFATRALDVAPLNFATLLLRGGLRLVTGQFERAMRDFRSAAEVRPNSSALYANMGVAYACMKRADKALASLRRAVALDPLNVRAVAMLADLAFRENRNEDAVPSLRLFLHFEQGDARMWSRLARALLPLGESNEAIAALKREAALESSSGVWNNLGIAYASLGDIRRAMESYKQAMDIATEHSSKDFLLAARNLAVMMATHIGAKDASRFAEPLVANDRNGGFLILSEKGLADLYTVAIGSLYRLGEVDKALRLSEEILSNPRSVISLRAWAVSGLIANLALSENGAPVAAELARRYRSLLGQLSNKDQEERFLLMNNIAFAFCEAGNLEDAEDVLGQLTTRFHRDSYPTATLGLYHFRRGHVERGERLYEEAISLARSSRDRARIRQKLDLERARSVVQSDAARARRLLERVIGAKDGDVQLVALAKSWRRKLEAPQ